MNIADIAKRVLELGKVVAPFIPGGQQGIQVVEALQRAVEGVLPGADPATAAELRDLRAAVNARIDRTLDSLGDG